MRTTGRVSMVGLCIAVGGILSTGCKNHDARVQEWNEFWGSKPKGQRRVTPVPAEQRPASAANSARTAEGTSRPKGQDNAGRGDPDAIERYTARMQGRGSDEYQPNDHTAKIRRQEDPQRRERIQKTAAHRSGGYDAGSESAETTYPESVPSGQDSPPVASDGGNGSVIRMASAESRSGSTANDAPAGGAGDASANAVDYSSVVEPAAEQPIRVAEPTVGTSDPVTARQESTPAVDQPVTRSEPEAVSEPSRLTANTSSAEIAATSSTPAKEAPAIPKLADVKIDPAPEPATITKTDVDIGDAASLPSTSVNAPPTKPDDGLATRLKQQEALVAADPNNVEEQYRLRMMYLTAGEDQKALAATAGMDEDIQRIMESHLRSLMAARSGAGRDPATWANRQLDSIENLRKEVQALADLRIPRVVLCTAIESFGHYKSIDPPVFRAGARNLALVYIEVDNFTSQQTPGGQYRTLLSVDYSVLSKSGRRIWGKRDDNIEDLAQQMRQDFYLAIGPIPIPKKLPPGEYVVKVEVEDVLAGKINSNVTKFKIAP